jgi:hypothetical protein
LAPISGQNDYINFDMSTEISLIERRKDAYYEAIQSGDGEKILHCFLIPLTTVTSVFLTFQPLSSPVPSKLCHSLHQYFLLIHPLAFNVLNINKTTFAGFAAAWFGGMESLTITSGLTAGNEKSVAMEGVMEFVSKEDNATFHIQKSVTTKLKDVSLVWYAKEGGDVGYEGWKVVKVKNYSSAARGE